MWRITKNKNKNERKFTRSKVIKVKSLNINLDPLSKDLEVKFGRMEGVSILKTSKKVFFFLGELGGFEDSSP